VSQLFDGMASHKANFVSLNAHKSALKNERQNGLFSPELINIKMSRGKPLFINVLE